MSDHDDRSRDRDDRDDRGGGAPRGGGEEEGKLFVGNLSFDVSNIQSREFKYLRKMCYRESVASVS